MTEGSLGNTSVRKAINNKFEDLVKDYKADFNDLWSEHFIVADDKRQIFITWDGVPADERAGRLAPYLTALDWILAYSLKLIRAGQAGNANFTVHLIDLTSNQFENSFTSENVPTLLEAMPWVTLYAPLKRGRIAYTELPAPEDVRKGNGWVTKKTLKEAAQDPGLRARLERLADMWQAWLIRSDDHHDVNNTAGPLRLCQTKNDISNASPLQKAFATRLEWVSGNVSQKNILEDLKKHVEKAKTAVGEDIDIVLVDDMHSFGWGKLFEEWCGIGKDDTLTPIEEPNRIVFKDTNAEEARWEKEDFLKRDFGFRFDFTIDSEAGQNSGNNQGPQVVFLDMRLHGNPANRAANERNEKDFFKKLVTLIETWGLNEENNQLAWPSIPQDDLLHAKDWASDLRPDRPLEIHSLLPRVMALRAPHIPIIILSSTRKRSVIEPLKPYGNIFTALEKPNVIGSDDGTLERFRSNWQEAWKDITMLFQASDALYKITAFQPIIPKLKNIKHVEIYIDETGSTEGERFCVGGFLVGYRNKEDATSIDDLIRNGGPKWYGEDKLQKYIDQGSEDIENKIKDPIGQCLKNYNCIMIPFGLYRHRRTDQKCTIDKLVDLMDSEALDNMFMELLKAVLEIQLFEILPLISDRRPSVNIYIATRQRVFSTMESKNQHEDVKFTEERSELWNGLYQKWGILPKKWDTEKTTLGSPKQHTLPITESGISFPPENDAKLYYDSVISSSAFNLVAEVLRSHKNGEKSQPFVIESAVAITLSYGIKPSYIYFRHLHYLADLIVRFFPEAHHEYQQKKVEPGVFNRSWDIISDTADLITLEVYGDEARQMLNVSRCISSNDMIGALLSFDSIPGHYGGDLKRIVFTRFRSMLASLSGTDFIRFCRCRRELDNYMPGEKLPGIQMVGQLMSGMYDHPECLDAIWLGKDIDDPSVLIYDPYGRFIGRLLDTENTPGIRMGDKINVKYCSVESRTKDKSGRYYVKTVTVSPSLQHVMPEDIPQWKATYKGIILNNQLIKFNIGSKDYFGYLESCSDTLAPGKTVEVQVHFTKKKPTVLPRPIVNSKKYNGKKVDAYKLSILPYALPKENTADMAVDHLTLLNAQDRSAVIETDKTIEAAEPSPRENTVIAVNSMSCMPSDSSIEESDAKENEHKQGCVKFFKEDAGWGFIEQESGDDIFVYYGDIISDSGFKTLRVGQRVEFEIGKGAKGPKACNVRIL